MFDPLRATKDKAQKAQKKKGLEDLKAWTLTLIPEDLRPGLIIDVNEVVCGDPSCAPIDTFFTLVWETTGKGVFAMPNPVAEISREDLESFFPVSQPASCSIMHSSQLNVFRTGRFWRSGKRGSAQDGRDCRRFALSWAIGWNAGLAHIQ